MKHRIVTWLAAGLAIVAVAPHAAAGPPQGQDGVVSGVGYAGTPSGDRTPNLFAFEAVRANGVVSGFVSRAFFTPASDQPVYERIGTVTCAWIDGDLATLKYVVTQTNQAFPVGEVLAVYARDGVVPGTDGVFVSGWSPGNDDGSRCGKLPKVWRGQSVPAGDVTIAGVG